MDYAKILIETENMQSEIECIIPDELNAVISRAKTLSAYQARPEKPLFFSITHTHRGRRVHPSL